MAEDDQGYGWVMFAGVLLMLLGTLNFIEGIAAVSKSHFFVGNAHYVVGDLKAWGWTVLIVGVIQGLAGLGILIKNQFARWLGVAIAVLNSIAQLMFIPAYPFWSLSLFALDVLVMYGLIAHGGRTQRAA
jgi:hypothetical protein